MYLEIFLADLAVFRVFWGTSWDFAEKPEIRGSATARIIRSPASSTSNNVKVLDRNLYEDIISQFLSFLSQFMAPFITGLGSSTK